MEKEVILKEKHEVKGIELFVDCYYFYDKVEGKYYNTLEQLDKNLKQIRNTYREVKGLLKDYEIKEIRDKYELSQKDFSLLLGLGEVTITRYESKMIQEKAQDELIRRANDVNEFLKLVEKNKEKYIREYSLEKYKNLYNFLKTKEKNELENIYINKNFSCEFVGKTKFSFEKCISVINEISKKIEIVTKTKLAKLLWYIDFYSYKKTGESITGTVYYHYPYGAVPYYFDKILSDNRIEINLLFKDDYECYIVKIKEKSQIGMLSLEEKKIVEKICLFFKNMNTKSIVDYMHQEDAYKKTLPEEIISYEYAKKLSI